MTTYEEPARPARRAPAPAWPALLAGVAAPLAIAFAVFWFRASLPDTNFGASQDDAVLRYWIKVIVICVLGGGALWAALWYGWAARSGRDIGLTMLALALIGTFAGAIGAVMLKDRINAAPRLVAEMERQWVDTQDRDVGRLISEINLMRIGDALDGPTLINQPMEAQYRTARARKAVQKHRRWREKRIEDYRARIARLPADYETRQRILSAFERQRRQTERLVMTFHDGVEDSLLQTEALSKYLQRARGRWRVEGDRIVFSSKADYDYFERGIRHYDQAFDSQAAARWDLGGNPLLARDRELFPNHKPAPRHSFVLF